MPVFEITLIEGYDTDVRTRLARAVTDAVRMVVPAPADLVTVITREAAPGNYIRGGIARSPAPALPDPVDTVRAFLDAMAARDLDAAGAFLGEGFTMHFPGAAPMTRLSDLVDQARTRYRDIAKVYAGFDACQDGDATVVYCRGTLSGHWPDGTPFAGIRFVDRFELTGGLIVRQDVWNDLAETKGAL